MLSQYLMEQLYKRIEQISAAACDVRKLRGDVPSPGSVLIATYLDQLCDSIDGLTETLSDRLKGGSE